MKTKDFNENEHCTCPKCGFEVLYNDAEIDTLMYIFKDGSLDEDTESWSEEDIPSTLHMVVECNHIDCDFNMPYESFVRNMNIES